MLGAILGDIVGSPFEFNPVKTTRFPLFSEGSRPTDDSIMTLAVADALLQGPADDAETAARVVASMQTWGRLYPRAGYGGRFRFWLASNDPKPYWSFGNGSAMRTSPCAWLAETEEESLRLARLVAAVTHDHPEGIKGAEAVTLAIFLARKGASKTAIRHRIVSDYYPLDFTLDEIRPTYEFDVSCQGSVPQALQAFFEADDFEAALRLAVSLGGDADTQAAIAGSVAEAFFGIPDELRRQADRYLNPCQKAVLRDFEARFPNP